MTATALLCVVFFLSGAAALLFETLWFHQAGLALGNSVWSASLVLAGFMGGLALGNGLAGRFGHRVRRRVRLYALLELAIGASGLGLVHALPELASLLAPALRPFLDQPAVLNPLRLVVAFALLVVPSTAMGATLPLLVAELVRRDAHFGRALGRLYGWNTLGAVVGAVAGHAAAIPWLGVRGSALAAAGANGAAAALALALARSLEATGAAAPAPVRPAPLPRRALALLAAAFAYGGILLALEVVWFRFLTLFVLAGSLTFALMLAVVLAGIGLGGLAGARWFRTQGDAQRRLPALALASAALTVLTYGLFDRVVGPFRGLAVVAWDDMLRLAMPLFLPVSFLSGVLFTLLGEALNREAPGPSRAAGYLTLANTSGAMLGSLVAGFVLLPRVGIERSIQGLALAYAASAIPLGLAGIRPRRAGARLAFGAAGALLLVLVAWFPAGLMQNRFVQFPIERYARREGSVPVAIREGLTETVIYLRRDLYGEPLYHRLLTNMVSMATTHTSGRRYMKLFAYWPVAVHPGPRRALLISYGLGMTAKALTDTSDLERIDVVDVSRDVLRMSDLVFPDAASRPLADPRVRVHVEDGRFFLQTTDLRFDLITGEPPPPKAAGVVGLFTREYFELLRARLAPGGIATYWLPVHSLREREALAIVRAFCEAFEDCSLWSGSGLDWMLVGTREARGPVAPEWFARQWRDPVVAPELHALGLELPEQLGALFLAGADDLRAATSDVPPLDDDHPYRVGWRPTNPGWLRRVYAPWLDADRARERFLASSLVRRLWPEELRAASLPYFEFRSLLDRSILGAEREPGAELRALDRVLAASSLRAPVLWPLGHDAATQRAARRALARGLRSPELDIELAAGALADRDFRRAADHFARARAQGATRRELLHREVLALCLAGELDEGRALAARSGLARSSDPADREAWRFLAERFSLDGG